jgi:hypothetical protein
VPQSAARKVTPRRKLNRAGELYQHQGTRDHLLLFHIERLRVQRLKPLHTLGCLSLKLRSLFFGVLKLQLQLLKLLGRVAEQSLKSFDLHTILRIT